MSATANRDLALELSGISKHFGGQRALDRVELTLRRGEIHALLGENGAGKSTLIKILAGAVQRDGGEIAVDGRVLARPHSPSEAARAGIAFVHQDLGLVDGLSVAENVALELSYRTRLGLISMRATERAVGRLLEDVGTAVSPRALIGDLAQDEKVMVAVTRAVSKGAQIIVLDEVSSSLPAPEMSRLAETLRSARRTGVAYLYVTHRLDEVFELADRVTVLRDGRLVATAAVADTSHDQLVEWILGGSLELPGARDESGRAAHPNLRLRVRDLSSPALTAPVSFDVASGEIVGICGLIGSGSREVGRLLGGAARPSTGEALLDGERLALGDPSRLSAAGCAYVPGDRGREGAVAEMSVRENLFLARRRAARDPLIRAPRSERAHASELARRYDIRPADAMELTMSALSGGNQQKVIFARALRSAPKLIVLDDPTAGVDVGSRVQLHGFLRESASNGCAVVLASTDFEEVASQADRVLVMRDGRVAEELERAELTPERLARASYGTSSNNILQEVVS
jgi:ribose transport system ATP-binding protein